MDFANVEGARFWSERAPSWIQLGEHLERVAGLPGQMAMDALGLRPGWRVIDLACGLGHTTIGLAERVKPGGVVGMDISSEMLAVGRQQAKERVAHNVELIHADVQNYKFSEGEFDAAFSRFGLMFFVDPVAAFMNVRRALSARGHLSFVCWQELFANEWMLVPGATAMSVLGKTPPMPGPDEPGPFSLADQHRIRSILDKAGFKDIEITPHNDLFAFGVEEIPRVAEASTRFGAVAELLRDEDESAGHRVAHAVEDELRSRVDGGEGHLSRGFYVVTAEA